MNPSELFIKRPVTTLLIMLGIIVFGAMAYRLLPVSDLPTVDYPTIQVNGSLPGASPETMASSVALPLEKQFASIAGLNNINSTSQQGSTNITLQFDLSRNIDAAAQDVQAMIATDGASAAAADAGAALVPEGEPGGSAGDVPRRCDPTTLPLSTVDEYAETDDRAAHLDGRAASRRCRSTAPREYAVRIDLNPRQLAGVRHRHRRRRDRHRQRQRQPADRHDLRVGQDVRRPGQRPAAARRGVRARRSSPTATATRCGSTKSPTSTTASRTTRRPAGTTASARLALDPQTAGHQRRRGGGRDQGAAADVPRAAARRRSRSTSAAIAPVRFAIRCAT